MNSYKFWNNWARPYRFFYIFLLIIFSILLVNYLATYYLGPRNIIAWETESTIQNIRYNLNQLSVGLFDIQIPSYTYLIEESYLTLPLKINSAYGYIFLFITFACLAIINTIITVLSRQYFLVGIAVLIIGFLLFKFDAIGILGVYEKPVLIGIIVIITGVSYFFHDVRVDFSFFKRLLVFLFVYIGILMVCHFFSEQKVPLLSLANHGIVFTSIISIIFIVVVSHEILYGFLFLVTYSTGPTSKNTLTHFVAVSLLYLLCLLLLYFKTNGFFDLDIFGTDTFLIFPFSVLIGYYGLKAREESFNNILHFHPFAALLYVTMAIICFATLGYLFATYNNPAIEAFQDYIIFSHIGIGVFYFIYIIVNFRELLAKNQKVYKVVYKPQRLPFYVVRIGGVIIASSFMFRDNFLQMNQSVSGYFNGLGDLSLEQQNKVLAEQYYKLALQYDGWNPRTNLSLANIFIKEKKEDEAVHYLKETFRRKPLPQAAIQLSNIYLKNNLYFDAIYTLREGTKLFPEDDHIYNNLSLLYNKTALVDSAFYYLNAARKFSDNRDVSNGNYWGFLARNLQLTQLKADSIAEAEKTREYLPSINNKIALLNIAGKNYKEDFPNGILKDTAQSAERFAILNNYSLNKLEKIDSSIIKSLQVFSDSKEASPYKENATLSLAIISYYNGDVKNAFVLLQKLKDEGLYNVGYYNLLLGIWSLENKAFSLAVEYFNSALEKGNKDAFYLKAIAESEAGDRARALLAWDNVIQLKDPISYNSAMAIKTSLLEGNLQAVFEMRDELKYHVLRYRFDDFTAEQRNSLIQTLTSNDIRIKANLLEAEKALFANDLTRANSILGELRQEKLTSTLKVEFENLYISYLVRAGNYNKLNNFSSNATNKEFIAALKSQALNKRKEASEFYLKALKKQPFQIYLISRAVSFYDEIAKNREAAYNIALDAVKLNPYSTELLKLYILQSLKVNLTTYAEDGMQKLKEIATESDFTNFQKKFQAEKIKQQSDAHLWQ